MTLQEILNWLERNKNSKSIEDRWSIPFKLKIMEAIREEYSQTHLAMSQSEVSREIVTYLNDLPHATQLIDSDTLHLMLNNLSILPPADSEAAHTAVAHYTQAEGTWNQLIYYFKDNQHHGRTLHTAIKKTLENIILDLDVDVRYKTHHASNAMRHRFKLFGDGIHTAQKLARDFEPFINTVPILAIFHFFLPFISKPIFSLLFLPGALANSLYHAVTRNPLAITQQKTFIENLKKEFSPERKRAIIDEIVKLYPPLDRTKSLIYFGQKSTESQELSCFLANPRVTDVDLKWEAIKKYVERRDGDTLTHNGKRLFNCIDKVVRDNITTEETATITMTTLQQYSATNR